MSLVLGVSAGASAVRMASRSGLGLDFTGHTVDVGDGPGTAVAARSVGVLLEDGRLARVEATAITYRDDAEATALHEAMAGQRLHNYHLVPEADAVVRLLEVVGQLRADDHTVVLYDLGHTGVTVSVVDRYSRAVLAREHSTVVGGDLFDSLIADQQYRERGLAAPADPSQSASMLARCRAAKEQLSTGGAACVPGDTGMVLLNRDRFEALIQVPVEASARLARDVVAATGRRPDLLVLLGGGSRIPLVQGVLRTWLGLPTIVPPEPEMVAAQGASLLATPVVAAPADADRPAEDGDDDGSRGPAASRRRLAIAGAAATGLLVVAGAGFLFDRDSAPTGQSQSRVTELSSTTAPKPSTTAPKPSTTVTAPPEPPAQAPVAAVEPQPAAPALPPPPSRRYLNLPAPIQIEVPQGVELPPGMTR